VLDAILTFAATETEHATEEAGGLAALGLNWQAFLFQLITFVIVLVLLRKFVYKKLIKTLEDRRMAVESSLDQAAETAKKLAEAEKDVAKLLAEARGQADEVVAASRKEATQMIADAEQKAVRKAEHIVTEAKAQMDIELEKARKALKQETAQLVAFATERVIGEKLDPAKDERLITSALKNAEERLNG
jgi:F-type H+-transporting ATPase subunit b